MTRRIVLAVIAFAAGIALATVALATGSLALDGVALLVLLVGIGALRGGR